MEKLSNRVFSLCVACVCLISLTDSVCAQYQQSLTTSSCTPGTAIGTIYAYGATSYAISSSNGQFAISTNGVITPQTNLVSGTYTIYVTTYGTTGTTTVPVQIVANCYTYGYVNTGTVGSFSQQSYYFTVTSCYSGTTIGSVYASGASGYTIASTGVTGPFTISSTGVITAAGELTNGVYSLQVTTFGSYSATVPVTITVQCSYNNYANNNNNFNKQPFRRHDDHWRG